MSKDTKTTTYLIVVYLLATTIIVTTLGWLVFIGLFLWTAANRTEAKWEIKKDDLQGEYEVKVSTGVSTVREDCDCFRCGKINNDYLQR